MLYPQKQAEDRSQKGGAKAAPSGTGVPERDAPLVEKVPPVEGSSPQSRAGGSAETIPVLEVDSNQALYMHESCAWHAEMHHGILHFIWEPCMLGLPKSK